MIERAVASLESGQLQRAIPKARRAARKSRHLHTGFWQHGASALELSSFWPPSQPTDVAHDATPAKSVVELLEPKLAATSFLLDFLYPNDTQSFLHRFLAPRPRSNRLRPLRRRQYSAQQLASFQRSEPSILCTTGFDATIRAPTTASADRSSSLASNSIRGKAQAAERVPKAPKGTGINETEHPGDTAAAEETFFDQFTTRIKAASPASKDAWSRYRAASPDEQQTLRPELILNFSKSDDFVECARASALFQEIPKDQWTDELHSAAIRAHAVCGDFSAAMDKFKDGLIYNFTSGMQYIIASAFAARNWPQVFNAWFTCLHLVRQGDMKEPTLEYLSSVPKLDTLFAAFEKHIKYAGLAKIRAQNRDLFSREVFDQLRLTLARAVLVKPCQPAKAVGILSLFNDASLYQSYIESMLQLVKEGKQSKSGAKQLDKIYTQYRQLANAAFTQPILQGMFTLFSPHNPSGLAQLYQDWTRSEGGLDKWAYEKFLTFYANSGDFTSVRDLWQRYVAAFPDAAKETSGYYSLVDAHAQSGSVAGVRQEMAIMQDNGVPLDLVIHNALLKCHVRAGNYTEAQACFAETASQYKPNGETYGHIMELHSANGNLEQTVAMFNQAQAALVRPSESMAKSLVVAYLHNGLVQEAEQICREMARRGITSTDIWNRLITAYAIAGKPDKCFHLLPAMQSNNLPWDHNTCAAVLLAQARARQTAPAHRLLRSAVADNLLPISANHFAIVMNSAINTNQVALVDILAAEMERADIQPSLATHLSQFHAGFVRAPTAERTARLAKDLVQYMRSITHVKATAPSLPTPHLHPCPAKGVTELKGELRHVGEALKLLIDKREMALAEELVTLYSQIRPVSQQGEHLPSDIIAIIMGAYLEQGQHDRVLQLWATVLKDIRKRTENPDTKTVFPVHAYHLSAPLAHVAKVYRDAGDGKRLLAYTQAALDAGFKFTRDTWNTLICCLADLGQWEPAMAWCESLLMPRWRGWHNTGGGARHHRIRLAAAERHELSDGRVLMASQPAVLSLQREWLRLRKLAAWSAGVTAKLRRIETQYPLLHHAFTTVDFDDLPTTWAQLTPTHCGDGTASSGGAVGEIPTSLNKAIMEDMLGAMPLADLLAMRLNLEGQLSKERDRVRREAARKKGEVYVPRKGSRRRF